MSTKAQQSQPALTVAIILTIIASIVMLVVAAGAEVMEWWGLL